MTTRYRTTTLASGLAFPEGPRWYADRFWFTDQHARRVCALDDDGVVQQVAATDDLPGGLGWLSDGSLLVVYMTQRRLMRLVDGSLEEFADLSDLASFHCNDMVVDRHDWIYVGNFGFDLHGGAPIAPAELIRVDRDGRAEQFAGDVVFPNGSVILPDGSGLLVAETFAHRLTLFGLDPDGRRKSRATWAELGERTPDGICLDADGAVWVASPGTDELIRVQQGGDILDRCTTHGTPYACMLGDRDRRTLFVCSSETDDPTQAVARASGRIEQVRVEVPGAGLP